MCGVQCVLSKQPFVNACESTATHFGRTSTNKDDNKMYSRNDSDKTLSHWDLLPAELKDTVFQYASPLTLFLNGPPNKTNDIDGKVGRAIWLEAFDIDWHGDLPLLPHPSQMTHYEGGIFNKDLARVNSRSMYERLCRLLPDATESNKHFAVTDKAVNNSVTTEKPIEHRLDFGNIKYTALRLLHIPMRHMWLDVLGNRIYTLPYACAQDCIIGGHTELLKHLINSELVEPLCIRNIVEVYGQHQAFYVPIDVAAHQGHLDVLKVMHDAKSDFITSLAMDYAAQNGHLDVVKWLHENRTEGCTNKAMDWAAKYGHLDVVTFLHENRTEGCSKNAMDNASSNGHLHVVKWLHRNRTEGCTTMAMDSAARNGHGNTVKWLHENRNEGCTTYAMDGAALHGDLDIVKFLHCNRSEGCTTRAIDWAADHNNLDIIKFLHENRTEGCTTEAMDRAILYNYVEVVRFLVNNRTEGFKDEMFRRCESTEVAEMLVQSMSLERKQRMMKLARSKRWVGVGVDALKKNLRDQVENSDNPIPRGFMGKARASISKLFSGFFIRNARIE